MIETLLRRFEGWGSAPAMVWQNDGYSYGWLRGEVRRMNRLIGNAGMAGCVVTLETDYSPHAAAALLALLEQRCIVIPLASDLVRNKREEYMDLAGAEWRIVARREKHSDTDGHGADVDDVGDTLSEGLLGSADKLRSVPDEDRCTATLSDAVPGGLLALSVKRFEADGLPPLLTELRQQQVGGLVIFLPVRRDEARLPCIAPIGSCSGFKGRAARCGRFLSCVLTISAVSIRCCNRLPAAAACA